MASMCGCNYDEHWDPMKEVDRLLNSIDENETDLQKIADVAHKCLNVMSLNDACKYMIEHKYPITDANIKIFMNVATQSYLIRLRIMKDLIFK